MTTPPAAPHPVPTETPSTLKGFGWLRLLLGLVMLISIFLPIRVLMSVGEASLAFKETLGAQPLPVFTSFVLENRPVFIALPFVLTVMGLVFFVMSKTLERCLLVAAVVIALNAALAFAVSYAVQAPLSRIMEMSKQT